MDEDERWQRRFEASQRRSGLKNRAIAYKGGKCTLCSYDNPVALEFHHMDPEEKDFEISSKMSWDVILPELEKCVLVCANHHKEIHAGFYPMLLAGEDEDRFYEHTPYEHHDTIPTEMSHLEEGEQLPLLLPSSDDQT